MYVIQDLLSNEKLTGAKRQEFLSKNKKQLERIEWMVHSLLKLSRLESGTVELKKDQVVLSNLVNESLATLSIPIEVKNQKIITEGNGNISAKLDLEWTVEAITNILKNAYEHTAEGGTITISYKENPLYAAIVITNPGQGISKEDLPHIFKRFYKSKNNKKDSIGIGLHMAKKILAKQNSDITVKSDLNGITIFEIQFYKNVL
ncbi:Phosphate regulon sensor protein PhoR [compost metagenome]